MAETHSVASEANANPSERAAAQRAEAEQDDPKGKKAVGKKRTKTGCMTCRKRRIKCDENKPRCKNCIKSKRECKGYDRSLDPLGAQQSHFATPLYAAGSPYLSNLMASHNARAPAPINLQAIAPKPPPSFDFNQSTLRPLHPQYAEHGSQDIGYDQTSPEVYASMRNPLYATSFSAAASSMHDSCSARQLYHDARQQFDVGGITPSLSCIQSTSATGLGQPLTGMFHYCSGSDADISTEDVYMAESENKQPTSASVLVSGPFVPPASQPEHVTAVRTFSTFAKLAPFEYMEYASNSELRNQTTHAIFTHFINITGPSMSLYERDSSPSQEPDQRGGNAEPGHNLFSYTIPSLALNHKGLFHAVMATANLQIANLQDTSEVEALKHDHWSLNQITKSERSLQSGTDVATLAASLLLAYFRVWMSDHSKWYDRLRVARKLFGQIALRDMSRVYLRAKREASFSAGVNHLCEFDYDLLSSITGTRVCAEHYNLEEGEPSDLRYRSASNTNIKQYDILRDLFWWYAKMDVYQSILGATKLCMGYEAWTQCPPRAPVSKFNAIYGTYDHLILLLGRLASFTHRDFVRKRKATTQSAPCSDAFLHRATESRPTDGYFPMTSSPPMGRSPPTDANDDLGALHTEEAATLEWESIRKAFAALGKRLDTTHFKPLNGEYADSKKTPFGPAVQYRTYSIAGIWMNYHMGLIKLYRSHPMMPLAGMQATRMAAQYTERHAMRIGSIAAGLADDTQNPDNSTTHAAALIESCFPLFVAAMQVQTSDQQLWILRWMYNISVRTGWHSAKGITLGCDAGFSKAYQLGYGPEYNRPAFLDQPPSSSWMLPRRLDHRLSESFVKEESRAVPRSEQTSLAFGLLGVEGDLDRLHLEEDD
ncbi:Fungal transcriptional regulatory protein [Drechmeria coniospora]|uniref:Fungal transcriptional regulatory protein n=1 Tax=Drechmeria coniospora TaxID=98403 RepID=A0A151GQZ9_DRECN|nr:Fungal transcriptional regulatory protein [Drechmeria coniospora]KYK59422.1 Fungal transcriptional regulatory protein [Drechmeria coniospora]ODA76337.1 hypothetical protein RJ55_08183 [Drechmeria coniospora]